jgi:hypothetical protein
LKLFQSVKGKKEEQEPVLSRSHTSARLVVQNPHNGWWRGRGTMGISKLECFAEISVKIFIDYTQNMQ